MKDKISITIDSETRAQLDALRLGYMHCPFEIPLSQMIASAISIAYFDHVSDFEMRSIDKKNSNASDDSAVLII